MECLLKTGVVMYYDVKSCWTICAGL